MLCIMLQNLKFTEILFVILLFNVSSNHYFHQLVSICFSSIVQVYLKCFVNRYMQLRIIKYMQPNPIYFFLFSLINNLNLQLNCCIILNFLFIEIHKSKSNTFRTNHILEEIYESRCVFLYTTYFYIYKKIIKDTRINLNFTD